MFYTYILYSKSINKYYVGYTSDLEKRFERHGKDRSKFTGQCNDWEMVKYIKWDRKCEVKKKDVMRGVGVGGRLLEVLSK